jgi:hypothetical protein
MGKDRKRVKWGRFGTVRVVHISVGCLRRGSRGLTGQSFCPDVKPTEALFGGSGPGKDCNLGRGQLVVEQGEPTLLEVLLAGNDEVDECGQDAVVKIL